MSYLKMRLALFREPGFALQIIACILCSAGFGASFVTMAWMVVSYSESVTSMAILMSCFWIPSVIFSPILGVLVDRYERRGLAALANIGRGVVLIALAIVFKYYEQILFIYSMALVLGVFGALYIPAAFTLMREIVPHDKLLYANATIDMSYEVGFLIGAAGSGFLIAATSTTFCLIASGIILILAGLCILGIRLRPELQHIPEKRTGGAWQSFMKDLTGGLRYLSLHPRLQMLYLIQLLVFSLFQTAPILLTPFVKLVLNGEAHEYGIIEAGLSFGALVGGMILPYLAGRYQKQVIIGANFGAMIGFSLFAFVNDVTAAFVLYFVLGILMSVWAVLMTAAQQHTEMAFQGRLTSLFFSLGSLLILLIYLLIGIVSFYLNVRSIYLLEVMIALISTTLSLRLFKTMEQL